MNDMNREFSPKTGERRVAGSREILERAPRTLAETGVARDLVVDLCMKVLFRAGRSSLNAIAHTIKLPMSVVGEVLAFLRGERLLEMVGHAGFDAEATYQLTEGGHRFAWEAMTRCQYIGPAPVSLSVYCERIRAHSLRQRRIDATMVRESFARIVIDRDVVDQMGAAMNSGRAILIYGPAGSGKTFLAEHLVSLLDDAIPVPYAITVGGEIIQMFDPLIHEPASAREADDLVRADRDERWLWCRRPVVIAGGELTLQMLDLQFDPTTRYYQAPPHLKANGGIFVVDDLGRQLVSPRDLMNRWIVPLDRNRDYLSLHSGFKFSIPFDMSVVFSTNLKPHEIADEAFLRRFGYKVYLGAMALASYRRIFEEVCLSMEAEFVPAAFDWLIEARHETEGRSLLACYPRDLVGRVKDFAVYERKPAVCSKEALARAWSTYFTTTGQVVWDSSDQALRTHGVMQ